jgi:hypothetical protein
MDEMNYFLNFGCSKLRICSFQTARLSTTGSAEPGSVDVCRAKLSAVPTLMYLGDLFRKFHVYLTRQQRVGRNGPADGSLQRSSFLSRQTILKKHGLDSSDLLLTVAICRSRNRAAHPLSIRGRMDPFPRAGRNSNSCIHSLSKTLRRDPLISYRPSLRPSLLGAHPKILRLHSSVSALLSSLDDRD